MSGEAAGWLSNDEIVLHRARAFHDERVRALATELPALPPEEGTPTAVVAHLVPAEAIQSRKRLSAAELKQNSQHFSPLGEQGGGSYLFNVDGFRVYSGHKHLRAYTQLFRDGRAEGVDRDAAYRTNDRQLYLRTGAVERGLFEFVKHYIRFARSAGTPPPIRLFVTLTECKGVSIQNVYAAHDSRLTSDAVTLPELDIPSLDVDPVAHLRPLCDCLWNAFGYERSPHYDEAGQWQERRS